MTRDPATGVWSVTGDASWRSRYYLYDVEVYVPAADAVVHNVVTDPYSLSLSTNSARSQIVDLADPALAPDGWDDVEKPELAAPEDLSIYELHVRDFSISDETVPAALRGTFGAFTVDGTDGMEHLGALADAGLGAVHLLPAFDFATVEEDAAARQEPDQAALEAAEPDSEEQQRLVEETRAEDGFNWGYDPWHYTAPEGSYSTDPDGPTRIVEFRDMVGALNETGLRVIMDVVYNHTTAGGQAEKSVLDRVVPGYYHRLNDVGVIETSTCCANTASEHAMMEKLLIDSVVTWARDYKVDGFRFDLMGHHSKANMLNLRAALDELTLADDGVDGSSIYLYGEGWNFGEVADNARFEQATQLNMAGTGIGTFNDRLRDAVRGGGPFDGGDDLVLNQGVINGLWYDTNELVGPPTQAQLERAAAVGRPDPCRPRRQPRRLRVRRPQRHHRQGLRRRLQRLAGGLQRRPAGAHRLRRRPRQPDVVGHRPVPPPADDVDRRPRAGAEPGDGLHRARPGRAVRPRRRGPAADQADGPQQLRLRRLVQPRRLLRDDEPLGRRRAAGRRQRGQLGPHQATARRAPGAVGGRHLGERGAPAGDARGSREQPAVPARARRRRCRSGCGSTTPGRTSNPD